MTDKPSPAEAFAAAPPNDPDRPRRVRCLNPFRWLEVNDDGRVTPCCSPWFKGHLGSIRDKSLAEIWNGPAYRKLREAMYPGGDWEKWCNAETCPHIQNDIWVDVDAARPGTEDTAPVTAEVLEEVRAGHTVMDAAPAQVGLSCDPRCNLRCIMCYTLDNPNRDGELVRRALAGLRELLPGVERIKMMGDGEVFAVPETREFLFQFDAAANPRTSFLLHTNGNLLTPELWRRIEHVRLDWIVVSLDAATQPTYEKIRRGGKWPVVMRNLEFLAQRQREGNPRELHINMCVMRSNHHEMVEFAELAARLGVTRAYFIPILGGHGDEQIFSPPDTGCLRRVAGQLRHPALAAPIIDASALAPWREWRPALRDHARTMKRGLRRLVSR